MSVHTKYFTMIQCSFLTLVVSCLMLTPAAGQVPNYRLQRIPLNPGPEGTVQANQMNNLGMVVGYHSPDGIRTGYIYDHDGLIGAPKTVHSLAEWIPVLPDGYTTSSCVGINNLGQVVGYFSDAQSQRIGYYLDLDLFGAGANPSWGFLPTPSSSSYGKRINDNQVVLIYSYDTWQGHLYNLASGTGEFTTLTDPTSGAELTFTNAAYAVGTLNLNDLGQVAGSLFSDSGDSSVVRLTPGLLLEFLPLDGPCSINDQGLVAGTLPATGKGKNSTPRRACRYDYQIEALSSVSSNAYDINNDGDVAGQVEGANAVYHDGLKMWVSLDDLLVGSAADLDIWFQATGKRAINIADRDDTGFGQILTLVNTTSTTGSGKNKVTTRVTRFFVLTPQLR